MYCIVPHPAGSAKNTGKSAGATQTKKKQSAVSDQQSVISRQPKRKVIRPARKGLAQTCYFSLLIRRAGYASIRQPSGVRWCLIFENLGIQQSAFSVQSK